MFIKFSYTSLLLVLLCCWCCVASSQRKVTFTDDAEEGNTPSTDYRTHCTDRVRNHDETDIDCGGVKCPRCEDKKACKTKCDCISGTCRDNKCSPLMSCEDKIQNQDETDVDCGGILCPKCTGRKICNGDCDCISGVCKDNKCVTGSGGESNGLCSAEDLAHNDPIVMVTFGKGAAQYSKKTPKDFHFTTTYKQKFAPTTEDGEFSLINSIHNDFAGIWHTGATDHTGDQGGYMFLVDADYKPGELYRGTVKNLCVGRRYEFSVYLANIFKPNFGVTKPNVLFEVRTTVGNELLAHLQSGDVVEHDTLTWKKYGLSFTATSNSVVLLLISKAPGGSGNDFAIDDIALRTCGEGSGLCPADE